MNFLNIGVIRTLFPEAKICHVVRDPIATCWSNYKQYFISNGLGYSYDLDDLVSYYRLYQELMRFWHEEFPGRLIEVNYDELTSNQEKEIKRLIGNLGLEWEEKCLSPHLNAGTIKTASKVQVRKKMYKDSSKEWKKYFTQISKKLEGLTSKI